MRIISFLIVGILACVLPFVWFLIPLVGYLIVWTGFELLIIGIIVDSIFGSSLFSFSYTLSIGVGILGAALVRPYMSWYDTDISSNL